MDHQRVSTMNHVEQGDVFLFDILRGGKRCSSRLPVAVEHVGMVDTTTPLAVQGEYINET
jgi:hypothetical protein